MTLDHKTLEEINKLLAVCNDEYAIVFARDCISQLQETEPPKKEVQSFHLSLARRCMTNLEMLGYRWSALYKLLFKLEEDVADKCDPQCIADHKQWANKIERIGV